MSIIPWKSGKESSNKMMKEGIIISKLTKKSNNEKNKL
jgi:hypothetical protein